MALGDPYATLAQLKSYVSIDATKVSLDESMIDALNSASREIEKYCDRQFNQDSAPTPRVYTPVSPRDIDVDDFFTTSGLVVKTDPGGTGSFSNTWASTDYELEPLNGIANGQPGWPYNAIHSVGGLWFPAVPFRRRATVQVTAQWGWPAVPAPVKQACLILASQNFKLKDAPFGVAGADQFGTVMRVQDNPLAKSKLRSYRRYAVLVG